MISREAQLLAFASGYVGVTETSSGLLCQENNIYDTIPLLAPGPHPGPWLLKAASARSRAQRIVEQALLIQQNGGRAWKFIFRRTDRVCTAASSGMLDFFVIGLFFKRAAVNVTPQPLKNALLAGAARLMAAGIS